MGDASFHTLCVGRTLFGVECGHCKHRAVFKTHELARASKLPLDRPFKDVLRMLKCSYCGRKEARGQTLGDDRHAAEWRRAARSR